MALLSLWLAEHQMNKVFDEMLEGYGKSKAILPLKEAGKIVCGNAAKIDWEEVCPKNVDDEIYVMGNPPYLGSSVQNEEQKNDKNFVFRGHSKYKNLDYVAIWFYKGVSYIKGSNAQLGFVTTNSVCQGEQVELIWPHILSNSIEIGFGYQSFKWTNNAKGAAGVTVIIIGLRNQSTKQKYLYCQQVKKEVKNISPYLSEGKNLVIRKRLTPLSTLPVMDYGNKVVGGALLLSSKEKIDLVNEDKNSLNFIKNFIGSDEFLYNIERYCLWIDYSTFSESLKIREINKRLKQVELLRSQSPKKATQKLSSVPYRFGEIRYKNSDAILIPRTSSERRNYIPIGLFSSEFVISDSAMAVYDAEPWLFGMLHSKMHMVWVNAVGGKLKTDYRYSNTLCYNTFPFPNISEKQKETINQYVFLVLDERAKYSDKTIAWMYNPETMPAGLKQAHKDLDEAIERIYRLAPFQNDAERLEYLFKLYEEMISTNTLFAKEKKSRKKKEQ